jgi:hypothetical protein
MSAGAFAELQLSYKQRALNRDNVNAMSRWSLCRLRLKAQRLYLKLTVNFRIVPRAEAAAGLDKSVSYPLLCDLLQ